jgi:hypothetical protein
MTKNFRYKEVGNVSPEYDDWGETWERFTRNEKEYIGTNYIRGLIFSWLG